jgi:hypothetical protein
MLAEIFMLSVEADARSLKVLTPKGDVARFVPIELPVPPVNGPPQSSRPPATTAATFVRSLTEKTLGLAISQDVLSVADGVIE